MISSASQLSVIIPAIDEEDALPLLLKQLWRQQDIELELILADGGSPGFDPVDRQRPRG